MITIDTYNKIAEQYEKEYGNDYSDIPYINRFLNYLVGCGVRNLTKYIFDKWFNVDGIDFSKELLNIAS